MEAQSYLWVSEGVSDEAYGLVMADNTMEPIIPEKAVMVVDPKHAVEPGNIVVARLDGQRNVAVGRLARYGGQILLRPANPEYKPQPMKRTGELLGVVIEFRVAL